MGTQVKPENQTLTPHTTIGIVVLNYRGASQTLACLDSLRHLSPIGCRVEIIVVDNASGDGSPSQILAARPEITLLESKYNNGYAAGNNLGADYLLAKGVDYLWILNNDTQVHPDSLKHMIDFLLDNPRIGAVGCTLKDSKSTDQAPLALGGGEISWLTGRAKHLTKMSGISRMDYITGASILVRKEAWQMSGGITEDYFLYWEDVDFSLRLKKLGWELGVASDAVVFHDESSTLGRRSKPQVYYSSRAFVRFMLVHSSFPLWTIFTGCLRCVARGVWLRNPGEARMAIKGTIDGWKGRKSPYREAPFLQK